MKRFIFAGLFFALAWPCTAGFDSGSVNSVVGFFTANVIQLSNASVASSASIGTTVGNLAVLRGTGSYTFSLTSNPGGLYSISGSSLQVAAALTAGSDPITVQASPAHGAAITQPFTITVTGGTNFLLVQTGSALLVNTGSKFLIQ